MSLKKAGIPPKREANESEEFNPDDITNLMRLKPGDETDGWRIVATYPAPNRAYDKRYRAAHARSQAIRAGKVKYLADLGHWEARAVLSPRRNEVHFYLRYLGPDGLRWAGFQRDEKSLAAREQAFLAQARAL